MLAARDYKQYSRIAMDDGTSSLNHWFDFEALEEVLSLADHGQAEPTSLANPCGPEATRPVEETKLCPGGGKYEVDQCHQEIAPTAGVDTNQDN